MKREYPLGVRSRQILSLLREHGPLSIGVLAQALEPPMATRRCQEVLQSLRHKGLVRRFNSYLPVTFGNFYALRKTKPELRQVAKALCQDPNRFEVCFVRGAEIKHGEQCALWAEHVKKTFPDAIVVRDWELSKHADLTEAFVSDGTERDLLPDIVVSFSKRGTLQRVLVAIEVERTKKESRRLLAKVRSLAMQTQLDGVIYVCGDFEIGEALRSAFTSAEITSSRRVGSYAADFILFTTFDALAGKLGPRFVNAQLRVRCFEDWIEILKEVPARSRTGEMFETSA